MDYPQLVTNQTSSSTNNGSEEALKNALRVVDILFLIPSIAWGIFANVVIITTIVRLRQLHKPGYVFLAHLAGADLFNCIFIMPLILANVALGSNATNEATCQVSGVMITFTCGMSVYSIVLVAVQRYLKICQPEIHKKVFAPRCTVAMVICLWVFCTICATPPLYGWSEIQYNEEQYLCAYSRTAAYSYNVFILVVGIVLPTVTIIFCYMNIFIELYKCEKRLQLSSDSDALAHRGLRQTNNYKKRATLTMLLITVMFAVCCVPYGILIVHDRYDRLPGIVHKTAAFLVLGNSCVNSIILVTRCREFTDATKQLLCTLCCKRFRHEKSDERHQSTGSLGLSSNS